MLSVRAPRLPRFIGHSTWTSRTGSSPKRAGTRELTTARSLRAASSGSTASMKKKSEPSGAVSSGMAPWLMRCALVMIRLAAAWRNTSVSRITGTAPEPITSASTWPGPTLGSWSTSPTSSSAA